MTRHLVTGGAGFVGSALVRRLLDYGEEVTVLDRFSRGKVARLPIMGDDAAAGLTLITGDIRDGAAVRSGVKDADVIWHLAYVQGTQTFYADPKDVIDVALTGIMNVLHACEEEHETSGAVRTQDLILVSSSEVYQNPPEGMYPTDETVPLSVPDVTNPRYSYGGGKIASELAALAYSQADVLGRAIIVRPHNIYGPDMGHDHVIPQFAERALKLCFSSVARPLPFPIQGTGEETRSFCHIDDCVDGLLAAYRGGRDREVYHLGNPAEEHSISWLAHEVAAHFGEMIEVVPSEAPKGSPTRRKPDISKLSALGFNPQVAIGEGLDDTLSWYAEHARAAQA